MIGQHIHRKTPDGRASSLMAELKRANTTMTGLGITSKCAQIFVTGPQTYTALMSADDIEDCREYAERHSIRLVIHGAYVDNPWNLAAGPLGNIKRELKIAAQLGASGVIVHLSAAAAKDVNLRHVLEALDRDAPTSTLWLEINAAKESPNTFETPAKIRRLVERITAIGLRHLRVGICIDTAHLFACGVALVTYEAASAWLEALPEVPLMMHLNDSESQLGSGKDKHAALTRGNIWGAYHAALPVERSGIAAILDWATEAEAMVILERHAGIAEEDLRLVHSMGYF